MKGTLIGAIVLSATAHGAGPQTPEDLRTRVSRELRDESGRTYLLELRPGVAVAALEAAGSLRDVWHLPASDDLRPVRATRGEALEGTTTYAQYHRGVPVHGVELSVGVSGGEARLVLGAPVAGLDLSPDPAVTEEEAYDSLCVAARMAGWLLPFDPGKRTKGGLCFASEGDSLEPSGRYLAWIYYVRTEGDGPALEARVDALTGALRRLEPDARESWAFAPGLYCNGPVPVDVTCADGPACSVQALAATTKWRITTKSMAGVTYGGGSTPPYGSARQSLVSSGPEFVTAHWAAYQLLDFFQFLGRNGLDDKGAAGDGLTLYPGLCSPVAACGGGFDSTNAFHLGNGRATFGGGAGAVGPLTDPDVVAHELGGHGLTWYSYPSILGKPGLLYEGESGAIDEAVGDIVAYTLKQWFGPLKDRLPPAALGWALAPGATGGLGLRRADDPHLRSHPKAYLTDPFWAPISPPCVKDNDWCGVHRNSTVVSHWFYKLVSGSSPAADGPIEFLKQDAFASYRVVYGSLTGKSCGGCVQAPRNATFPIFRAATEAAAKGVGGEDAEIYYSVARAWQAVGVGAGPVDSPSFEAAVSPAAGATEVPPWPAQLKWGKRPYETEWTVQISETDAFPVDATITQAVAGVPAVSVPLRNDRQYFWRVRASKPAAGNWRATRSFKTRSQTPSQQSPESLATVIAWEVDLAWSAPAGATGYDVEVSLAADLDASPKTFTSGNQASAKAVVPVDGIKVYYWRVRSRCATNGDVSAWSGVRSFETTLPQVKLAAPAIGATVYPWSVLFQWTALRGATTYKLEYGPGPDASGSAVDVAPVPVPGTVGKAVPLAADGSVLAVHWRVRVWGGPSKEEGIASGIRSFAVDAIATKAVSISPYPAVLEVPYAGPLTITWASVSGATEYEIVARPMNVAGTAEPGGVKVVVPAAGRAPGTQSATVYAVVDPPYGTYGFYYDVRAKGPDGSPGWLTPGEARVVVRPDTPKGLTASFETPAQGDLYAKGAVGWTSQFAPQGHVVHLFGDAGCSRPTASIPYEAKPKGVSGHSFFVDALHLALGAQLGVRIETPYPPGPAFQGLSAVVSACKALQTPAPPPPPEPINSPLAFELLEGTDADFDMIITDPNGVTFTYDSPNHYVQDTISGQGPDIAYWGSPPKGTYSIVVYVYSGSSVPTSFTLRARRNGSIVSAPGFPVDLQIPAIANVTGNWYPATGSYQYVY